MILTFSSPELAALLQDLVNAPARITPAVTAVVVKGALNIKTDMRTRFTEQRVGNYLPHFARSITYDLIPEGNIVSAEIGPVSAEMQGDMGAAIEYGSVTRRNSAGGKVNAPMPFAYPSLDAEEPKFLAALAVVAETVLGK